MSAPNAVIREAVRIIRAGGLVAYPTETYYGLGVDPGNQAALERLFALKGRQQAKPVLVLIGERDQVGQLAASVPRGYLPVMDRFWPGPVTLIFPARKEIPELLTGRTGSVGIRQSPHPCAARLLARLGGALTATSANLSGTTPACTAEEVRTIFSHQVDLVLDDGPTPGQRPSTLVAWKEGMLVCLREGTIPFARILRASSGSGER